MNTVKLVLSALGVFAVVGSALAYKPMNIRDLYICNASTNFICRLPATPYSKVPGTQIQNPGDLFEGVLGTSCKGTNPQCVPYLPTRPVFFNQ